jgi:hypothetical protein
MSKKYTIIGGFVGLFLSQVLFAAWTYSTEGRPPALWSYVASLAAQINPYFASLAASAIVGAVGALLALRDLDRGQAAGKPLQLVLAMAWPVWVLLRLVAIPGRWLHERTRALTDDDRPRVEVTHRLNGLEIGVLIRGPHKQACEVDLHQYALSVDPNGHWEFSAKGRCPGMAKADKPAPRKKPGVMQTHMDVWRCDPSRDLPIVDFDPPLPPLAPLVRVKPGDSEPDFAKVYKYGDKHLPLVNLLKAAGGGVRPMGKPRTIPEGVFHIDPDPFNGRFYFLVFDCIEKRALHEYQRHIGCKSEQNSDGEVVITLSKA